ncbi:MAG: 2,3-bisphosphoglycerate-independent phosphoglycerate mutase [Xanthomonadales bacterium]|nr:2,3-bisphosphoglycerate-independent phosphoglycerate mutase [Xanthomonadales bacterium]
MSVPRPILLLILDGWGYSEISEHNAIAAANCPNWRRLWRERPHGLIRTDGLAVGLPEGQMGNSEVGHMNLGAGRIVYQDLTRIDAAIADGSLAQNAALQRAILDARDHGGTLHLLGLLSPGGVHSHQEHLFALLRLCAQDGLKRVAVHAFLDGRDTPPRSAEASLQALAECCRETGAQIYSIGGRYFGMDRDKRWDRVQRAWDAIVNACSDHRAADALAALQVAYARGENDEFVQPTVLDGAQPMADGDSLIFFNFRADRARQFTAALSQPAFDGFDRGPRPALRHCVTLTEYAADLPVEVAFPNEDLRQTLPELVAEAGRQQLRIAETEKYAHVTFFFSGGRESEFPGESRILVASPKVATYDLQPEMSCPEVTDKLVEAIGSGRFDLIVCNLANPDMVGHTGIMAAAVKAVETVDAALGRLVEAIESAGGAMLVTADHGNLEQMWDAQSGQPNTQHSTNPVPVVFVGPGRWQIREGGSLRDVAPTLLQLLELPVPKAMTGRSLLIAAD